MFGFNYSPPVISSIRLENLEVSAQSAASTAIEIKNDVQALHDTVLQYRNESEFYFTQVQQIQEGDYVTTQSLSDRLGSFTFDDLAAVPTAFTPAAHSHLWADITDKPLEFNPVAHGHSWSEISDKPAEFEPAEHVHSWQQIAQKPGTFPPESHFHNWADIENKPAAFNPVAHSHSWGDITGKPATFTPSSHGHSWSQISDKPTSFNPAGHTHNWSDLRNLPGNFDSYITAAGIRSKLKSVDGSGSGIDADMLDGQHIDFFRNASHLNSGTLADSRLNRSYNYSANGYSRQPGGFIVQWGKTSVSDKQRVSFPTAFPVGCMVVVASGWYDGDGDNLNSKAGSGEWDRTGFKARRSGASSIITWVAVGY